MQKVKFGVFDHMDDSGLPLGEHYEARLKMIEAYEAAGMHGYHIAEHHGTPLGFAPSPSVLLAAAAQRTSRIRIGSLIHALPFYDPLRLIEELCMLDHMSDGRLMFGMGKGASPVEAGYFGVSGPEQQERYIEASQVILRGLTSDVLTFKGKFYNYENVPMTMKPKQVPHPEIWYGARLPDSFAFAAKNGWNAVTLALDDQVKELTDTYKAAWAENGGAPEAMPLVGASRHIVVADTDEKAKDIARRAYAKWLASFRKLWLENGFDKPLTFLYPDTWDELEAIRNGCAGSPETVRNFAKGEIERGGFTYLISWFAFGDLSLDEVTRSVGLFRDHVMPAFD